MSTPVETIQEDISEAEPTTSPAPSLFRNRKVSQEYLQAGGGVAGDDPDVEEIIEGPGLTLSDEEFQENYLGNIPANKRKYGVFPHQYRTITTPAASTPVGVHPPTAARLVVRRQSLRCRVQKQRNRSLSSKNVVWGGVGWGSVCVCVCVCVCE